MGIASLANPPDVALADAADYLTTGRLIFGGIFSVVLTAITWGFTSAAMSN